MATMLNDGYCPECQLNDEDVALLLNKDDFWECPKSNLQLAVHGITAVILKFRGIGKFREEPVYGTHEINGAVLTRAEDNNIFSDRSVFDSPDELKIYLDNEVEPQLELSLYNLADTYAEYQYAPEFSPLLYKRQSKYFKIDFENRSILKKLEKRDQEEGMPYPRSYIHVYSLLLNLFQNYYNGNKSWLPDMGMSLTQLELCNKHLHSLPEPITYIEDKEVIKKRLLAFIVDLIEIICRGKKVELHKSNNTAEPALLSPSAIMGTSTLTLQEILNLKTGLFKNARVKLVRHKDNRKEYRELIKDKTELLRYQEQQSKEVFKDCDYIISFIGQERKKSLLFGIFKVSGVEKIDDIN